MTNLRTAPVNLARFSSPSYGMWPVGKAATVRRSGGTPARSRMYLPLASGEGREQHDERKIGAFGLARHREEQDAVEDQVVSMLTIWAALVVP